MKAKRLVAWTFLAGFFTLVFLTVPKASAAGSSAPLPIDSATGVISNAYWGITPGSTAKGTQNAQNIGRALQWAGAKGIGTVRLQKALYYIDACANGNSGVLVPSHITLDLGGSTLQALPNASTRYAIFTLQATVNVTIENGTLIGERYSHSYTAGKDHEYGFGIDVYGAQNVTLKSLNISKMMGDAIVIEGNDYPLAKGGKLSRNITVTGCKLTDCRRQGISVVGADTVDISGCQISNIHGYDGCENGIDLEACLDWTVSNVHIHNNVLRDFGNASVVFHIGSQNCVLENNTIDGEIAVAYGVGNVIRGNNVSGDGILVFYTGKVVNTLVEKNTLNGGFIVSMGNTNTTIRYNKVTDNFIYFSDCSGSIYGNTIINSGDYSNGYAILLDMNKKLGGTAYSVLLGSNQVSGKFDHDVKITDPQHVLKLTQP